MIFDQDTPNAAISPSVRLPQEPRCSIVDRTGNLKHLESDALQQSKYANAFPSGANPESNATRQTIINHRSSTKQGFRISMERRKAPMKNVAPHSPNNEAARSDAAIAIIASIGLTAVIVWADLLGHGFGFAPSSSIIQQLGNARLFFLVGFTLCAIGSVLLAKAPQRKTQVLTKAVSYTHLTLPTT